MLDNAVPNGPWWTATNSKGNLLLDRHEHAELIAARDKIAYRSGLGAAHVDAIWSPLPLDTTNAEQAWLVACIQRNKPTNLRYDGLPSAVYQRFALFCGALIRNFVDARLLTVDVIADAYSADGYLEAEVLFIPDFVIPGEIGVKTDRMRQAVISVFRKRLFERRPTIIFAEDSGKAQPWGASLHDEIRKTFIHVGTLS